VAELAAGTDVICMSSVLSDCRQGIRFRVAIGAQILPAFAIRYRGRVYAYVNRCAHQGVELDWKEGYFFDSDGEFLICATHGALYHPDSGTCAGGPCKGGALVSLAIAEDSEVVRLIADGVQLID
jgi:nitrite reductase/ring-hydroxylating ferredoxin subunit